MIAKLLIEIGTEELPAIPFLKEEPFILQKFQTLLQEYRIQGDCVFYYTPRRLVIMSDNLACKQEDSSEEFFGPPLAVAYKDNQPTKAFESFIKRCEITASEVSTTTKDNKEVLYYKKHSQGKATKEVLAEILGHFLSSLQFGKSMRWGSLQESFIRPVRSLIVMLNDELIPMSLYNIASQKATFVHRSIDFKPMSFNTQEEYLELLKQNAIILNPKDRRQKILAGIKEIEQKENIEVELDEELLAEVVAITENPTPLLGYFEEHFLKVPQEVIITSMKENQRYFATYKNQKLFNGFIVVSNACTNDSKLIIQGNERVLRARLSDALFFYENDLKKGFTPDLLESVRFIEGLGSMKDKAKREGQIVQILAELYAQALQTSTQKDATQLKSLIEETARIHKADLVSETVYEFTELQGVIGGYIAKHMGMDSLVCEAIKEQYLPKGQNDDLPQTLFSALFALAYRLDNLFSLFCIHKIPSGSKDPFSLRRSANGILKISLHFKLPFDLSVILPKIAPLYQAFDVKVLERFFLERIDSLYTLNPSLITAVLSAQERDILQIDKKLIALDQVLREHDPKELSATFKRVANITKDIDIHHLPDIKPELLNATEELELYKMLVEFKSKTFLNPKEELENLMAFKPMLDRFFNVVLVNAPDEALKQNRKALIGNIYESFLKIADIKEIAF